MNVHNSKGKNTLIFKKRDTNIFPTTCAQRLANYSPRSNHQAVFKKYILLNRAMPVNYSKQTLVSAKMAERVLWTETSKPTKTNTLACWLLPGAGSLHALACKIGNSAEHES